MADSDALIGQTVSHYRIIEKLGGSKPELLWKRTLDLLQQADLTKIKMQFPGYPHPDLLRAIQVSVDSLDTEARKRYLALAVLLDDTVIDPMIRVTRNLPPRKVTNQGFANAIISTCTEFLVGTGT